MRSNRRVVIAISAALVAVVAVLYFSMVISPTQVAQMQSAFSNVLDDAQARVSGQIGVWLGTDNATGLPVIESVLPGGPAELAGIKPGDVVTHVNNRSLSGIPVAQAGAMIRGYSGGSVELTVRRLGNTNALVFTINRASVKTLRSR